MKNASLLFSAFFLLFSDFAQAGSATWNLNPVDNNWNNANNWTPVTIPNSTSDVATFNVSNITSITPQNQLSNYIGEMVFNPGASAYTFNINVQSLSVAGAGVTNNSGDTQNFFLSSGGYLVFLGSATGGNNVKYTVNPSGSGGLAFTEKANAGSATYVLVPPADLTLASNASAANGVFENQAGAVTGQAGGTIHFASFATAGNATITNEGGAVAGALGAITQFANVATAGNATLIARGGTDGGPGGLIQFVDGANGGKARIELFDRGMLDIGSMSKGFVAIGSLEGNGYVLLGTKNLTIGHNNRSTTFSGIIEGYAIGDSGGSITKVGAGRLTLTKRNTYPGGTIVSDGELVVNSRRGSGTGRGLVQIENARLSGHGFIAGVVVLSPGFSFGTLSAGSGNPPSVLTINNFLTFHGNSTNEAIFNSDTAAANQTTSGQVLIESPTTIVLVDKGNSLLPSGTVFTVFNNTSGLPILGTFDNLPEGGTITVGNNTFQANYAGGDGNDLTLTVVSK